MFNNNHNIFSPKNITWAMLKKSTGIDINPAGKYTEYFQRKILGQVFDIPDDEDEVSSEEDKGHAKKYGSLRDKK